MPDGRSLPVAPTGSSRRVSPPTTRSSRSHACVLLSRNTCWAKWRVGCLKDVSGRGDVFAKPVADVSDAMDINRMSDVVFDLFPQRRHVRVDRPVCHVDVLAPDL